MSLFPYESFFFSFSPKVQSDRAPLATQSVSSSKCEPQAHLQASHLFDTTGYIQLYQSNHVSASSYEWLQGLWSCKAAGGRRPMVSAENCLEASRALLRARPHCSSAGS